MLHSHVSEEIVSKFSAQAKAVGSYFTSVTNSSAVTEYVAKLASASKATRIAVCGPALSAQLAAAKFPCELISRTDMNRIDFFEALKYSQIGVTGADFGIAETGTLVITATDELDRLVSALPLVHIAILPRSKLVVSLDEAREHIAQILTRDSAALSISLISASSRTTDVGGIRILGVHGPKELHILLLNDSFPGVA
jgi:L-lactate dehydrogenase complex protein LldG